jgi:hypothetical protein
MPFVVHVEIRVRRRAIPDAMLGTDEINVIPLVKQQVPEIVAVAVEPLVRFRDGIPQRHDLDGGIGPPNGGTWAIRWEPYATDPKRERRPP